MEKAFFSRPASTNPKKLKKEWGLTAQQAQQADVIDDDILEAREALKRKADEAESDNEEGLVTKAIMSSFSLKSLMNAKVS